MAQRNVRRGIASSLLGLRLMLGLMLVFTASARPALAADDYQGLIARRQFAKAAAVALAKAQAGDPQGAYRLAVMLRSGLGVKRDEGKARAWAKIAAAAGHRDAARMLRRLSSVVTSEGIAIAAAPPTASARVADLARAAPLRAGMPGAVQAAAARRFEGIEGLTVEALNTADAGGETALIAAVRAGNAPVAVHLLAAGAVVDHADGRGFTALHWAARTGNAALVAVLITAGADRERRDRHGETPAIMAAARCDATLLNRLSPPAAPDGPEIVRELAKSCEDPGPFAAILDAAQVNQPDSEGRTPLWHAARRGSEAFVAHLLAQGAPVDAADQSGLTPLHVASARGALGVLVRLMAHGADPTTVDRKGNTALMLAAAAGHEDCVAHLLAAHSALARDLDRKNADGDTALLLAAKAGHHRITATLTRAGASLVARNLSRDTPQKVLARLGLQP